MATHVGDLHRYDVNLSILFTELPLLERPAAAAGAGFDAVELWWPFDGPEPADREVDALVRAVEDAGVQLASLNFDAGDMAGGDRGLLSDPAQVARFRANVPVAVGIAERLGCGVLNALFGNRPAGLSAAEQRAVGVEQLAHAAGAAAPAGATVVVEALNPFGAPDYPLHSTAAAAEVAAAASAAAGVAVKLCYDVFHMQQAEGNLIATVRAYRDRIGHVQVADVPGRGEPGTGEIAYPRLLAALARAGYDGYVGLEYEPASTGSADSFAWLDQPVT